MIPPPSEAMEDCSIVRVPQLWMLRQKRLEMSHVIYLFNNKSM